MAYKLGVLSYNLAAVRLNICQKYEIFHLHVYNQSPTGRYDPDSLLGSMYILSLIHYQLDIPLPGYLLYLKTKILNKIKNNSQLHSIQRSIDFNTK